MDLKEFFAPSKLKIYVFLSISILFVIFLGAFSASWFYFILFFIFSYYYACHIIIKIDKMKNPSSVKLLADFFIHYLGLMILLVFLRMLFIRISQG
ncbi:hypothetical protein JW968_04315 [Candidatus Woesearchaeota archaeon]|nr:hypothetical protein [Candidatus Woesearchaeota archaeon]